MLSYPHVKYLDSLSCSGPGGRLDIETPYVMRLPIGGYESRIPRELSPFPHPTDPVWRLIYFNLVSREIMKPIPYLAETKDLTPRPARPHHIYPTV